jgi:hypothetical protein
MLNTIERKVSDINDTVTGRLDDLETSLPTFPSKALAASRAGARRVNDIVGTASSSLKSRFDTVSDDTTVASETASDDAKVASNSEDYADMTGARLHEHASALGIDGRSGMNKAELVGALRKV